MGDHSHHQHQHSGHAAVTTQLPDVISSENPIDHSGHTGHSGHMLGDMMSMAVS